MKSLLTNYPGDKQPSATTDWEATWCSGRGTGLGEQRTWAAVLAL